MNFPIYIDNKIYSDHLIKVLGFSETNLVNVYPEEKAFFIYKDN